MRIKCRLKRVIVAEPYLVCKVCGQKKDRVEFPPSGRLCWVCAKVRNRRQRISLPEDRGKRHGPIQRLLANRLRQRLSKAVVRGSKAGSAVSDLGCSMQDFRVFIERQFSPGMTWMNYGEWHLDHKIPLITFDLAERTAFLAATNYMNYQPLWAKDNLIKGRKIIT